MASMVVTKAASRKRPVYVLAIDLNVRYLMCQTNRVPGRV